MWNALHLWIYGSMSRGHSSRSSLQLNEGYPWLASTVDIYALSGPFMSSLVRYTCMFQH